MPFRLAHTSTIVTASRILKIRNVDLGVWMSALPAGRHYFRNEDGYEEARRGTVWHQRVPARYPEVIVQAADADDIKAGLAMPRPTAIRSASSRADTVSPLAICATDRFCSTSAASITPASTPNRVLP